MLSLGKITYVQASKQFLLFHIGTAYHQLVSCFDKLLIFQTVAEEKIDEDCIVKWERSPSLQQKNIVASITCSTPAMPGQLHCLQNLKWPLGGFKMASGIWNDHYPKFSGISVNFS